MKAITISLVITVLNERQTIESLLTALQQQTTLPLETIIVDGGSKDGTYEWLQEKQRQYRTIGLKVFQAKGNRSVGRNRGIQAAQHDWIAITDAGCLPHFDWLEKLKAKVTEYQLKQTFTDGLVVAGYYDARPKTAFESAVVPYVLVMPDQVNPHAFLPATRSMLLHKRIWTELNGFNEQLSDNEDYDFARRLKALAAQFNQSGYETPIEIVFAGEAKVTWLPRTTLRSFAWMIYRFARGDMKARLIRPKVVAIFGRYMLAVMITALLITNQGWLWGVIFVAAGWGLYSLWAIVKNYRYVKSGWYWLPVLQVVSDLAVMSGSLAGVIYI